MNREVVSVATTPQYQKGHARLLLELSEYGGSGGVGASMYKDVPKGCPPHSTVPYAFKAYALKRCHDGLVLWCDSSVVPIRSLDPLWERIERDGYWFSRNGFANYEWTADSAYPDLFPAVQPLDARFVNRQIPHVVATAFGLNLRHEIGRAFLDEYYRLASETTAFCGPWTNSTSAPCGPADVRGHRHDQTAASVIAWRLAMKLTDPPDVFAYGKVGVDKFDARTILVADGSVFA